MRLTEEELEALMRRRGEGGATAPPSTTPREELERDLMNDIIEESKKRKWRYWHDNSRKRNLSGFPDLVLVRKGTLIFAELKKHNTKPSPTQQLWLNDLDEVRFQCENESGEGNVDVYVWRRSDWETIKEILR